MKKIYMSFAILFAAVLTFVGKDNIVKADDFDYDSIPLSEVSYGGYGEYDSTVRSWGMVTKDNAIYLVVNTDPRGKGQNQFQPYGFNFKLGDQSAVLNIANGEQLKLPAKVGETVVNKFQTNNYSSGIQEIIPGNIVLKESKNPDHPTPVLNIKIPLKTLVKDPSLVNKVELNNPNFGGEKIVNDGASTSPVLSIVVAVTAVSIIGFVVYRRKCRVA